MVYYYHNVDAETQRHCGVDKHETKFLTERRHLYFRPAPT